MAASGCEGDWLGLAVGVVGGEVGFEVDWKCMGVSMRVFVGWNAGLAQAHGKCSHRHRNK